MKSVTKNLVCNTNGRILSFLLSSPIGDLEILSCHDGLHSVKQCDEDDSTFAPDKGQPVQLKCKEQENSLRLCKPANDCYFWLQNYFTQRKASVSLPPVCHTVLKSESFCAKALQLLPTAAPMGTTITYKDLAEVCGNKKACRAAGHAMATNPISLLIPCHRVVSSHNGPGNYSQGKKNKIKCWLLDFEKN